MIKNRNSNLELYRILLMLAIVAHHYVVNSGLIETMRSEPVSFNCVYGWIFGMWGKIGINGFVMITGYFMCKSNITARKFMKLLLEVEFYNVIIYGIFLLTGCTSFHLAEAFSAFIPVNDISHGFTSCFLIFYLFIPFLNIFIQRIGKKEHLYFIILCLTTYTIMGTLLHEKLEFNYVTWFCILYFIASYIRLYDPINKKLAKKISWGGIFLAIQFSILMIFYSNQKGVLYLVSDANKIIAVLIGVSSFCWFKDIKIPQSKQVNTVAQSCFGVLLIHANNNEMRQWLWKDVLNVSGQYTSGYFVVFSLLSVISVYVICTIIDQLRIKLIETPLFLWLDKKVFKI